MDMTRPADFLEGVRDRLPDGAAAESTPGWMDRLSFRFHGHPAVLDFPSDRELCLELGVPVPHNLVVTPESLTTRTLDRLGLSAEVRIGDEDFDARYLIQGATEEQARATLTPEFRRILRRLEPFLRFEMTLPGGYLLVKAVDLQGDYGVEWALQDLENLARLAGLNAPRVEAGDT